jgi:hypothetical protein
MTVILPKTRPHATAADIAAYVAASGRDLGKMLTELPVLVVGVRGYYLHSMGDPERNDRGLYDDAIFLLERTVVGSAGFPPGQPRAGFPDPSVTAFNANTDPSRHRRGIATLVPGLYLCSKWMHRAKYPCLLLDQDAVTRDGMTGIDRGRHYIEIHWSGLTATGSDGCQTIPRTEYDGPQGFQQHAYRLMYKHGMAKVPYLLVENKG